MFKLIRKIFKKETEDEILNDIQNILKSTNVPKGGYIMPGTQLSLKIGWCFNYYIEVSTEYKVTKIFPLYIEGDMDVLEEVGLETIRSFVSSSRKLISSQRAADIRVKKLSQEELYLMYSGALNIFSGLQNKEGACIFPLINAKGRTKVIKARYYQEDEGHIVHLVFKSHTVALSVRDNDRVVPNLDKEAQVFLKRILEQRDQISSFINNAY